VGTASGTGEGLIPTAGQLRAFIAVAEELHFRRAARRLKLAAPSLSETLRRLEDALGLVLLERTSREVLLTDAGAACSRAPATSSPGSSRSTGSARAPTARRASRCGSGSTGAASAS
jgi:LysR family transcriptional regulator, benzoate and cis,cis-muconate-responsive activator of ben and cat genes